MSEENVRFVVDGYARFNAGTKEAGLWSSPRTPNTTSPARIPIPPSIAGSDAVRRQFARWVEAYPDLTLDARAEALEAAGLSE